MFVGVVHLMKHPQRVSYPAFPLMIWLRPLHHGAVFRADALQLSGRPSVGFYSDCIGDIGGAGLRSSLEEDGIFGRSEGVRSVEKSKLPGKIVKAGSQKVGDFTDHDAPIWIGGRRFADAKPKNTLAYLQVCIDSESIGFDVVAELDECSFELIDFGMSSCELESWVSQKVHKESSQEEQSFGG